MESVSFQYKCGLCDDLTFPVRRSCMAHLREQHAAVSYKCVNCKKIFRRNDNPHACRMGREGFIHFGTKTGARGEAAAKELEDFMKIAEREFCIELLNGKEVEKKSEDREGGPTARKRTQPMPVYNGKRRRERRYETDSSSSSASDSDSSSDSETDSCGIRSEDEKHLAEIGEKVIMERQEKDRREEVNRAVESIQIEEEIELDYLESEGVEKKAEERKKKELERKEEERKKKELERKEEERKKKELERKEEERKKKELERKEEERKKKELEKKEEERKKKELERKEEEKKKKELERKEEERKKNELEKKEEERKKEIEKKEEERKKENKNKKEKGEENRKIQGDKVEKENKTTKEDSKKSTEKEQAKEKKNTKEDSRKTTEKLHEEKENKTTKEESRKTDRDDWITNGMEKGCEESELEKEIQKLKEGIAKKTLVMKEVSSTQQKKGKYLYRETVIREKFLVE